MSDVTVTIEGGKVYTTSPYHPDFARRARKIGGNFLRDGSKRWIFDIRDEARARDLLREFYGTDGSPAEAADLVTVRVRVADFEISHYDGGIARFAGRIIAERRSRDGDVRLAANVVLVAGAFDYRGGSVRYPRIDASKDVIVEIRDIPRAALGTEDPDKYEIVGESPAEAARAALLAEREQLLARLAEIDAALGTEQTGGDAQGDRQDDDNDEHGTPAAAGSSPTPTKAPAAPVSTAEFAAAVGRTARTIRRWIAAGKVAARKIGGAWIITPAAATA